MFKQDLKEKYPFLTNYFEAGIKNPLRSVAHSMLFYGQDISAQYELATEIARLLNCKESQDKNCQCLNCKWIRNKEHPAVLTFSKIDNKPDDDSKTVISVKQALIIKNSLLNTSDYQRVFIFCDAKMDGETWVPLGLNETNFQEEAANTLLKTIEEPPENTTFFFLTRDKSDLIGTIVSRSQSFFVPSYNIKNKNYSIIEEAFENYLNFERRDFWDLSQNLFALSKEQGSEKVLDEIQNLLAAILKSNLENASIKNRILFDLKEVKLAQLMIEKHINPQLVFENLCLTLTK